MRVLLALVCLAAGAAHADEAMWKLLARGGQVVLIRHAATTPGTGDPREFRLDDCATQRNLSDEGREEAKRIGAEFRRHRVPIKRVLASPWCRCMDTAELAFGDRPRAHSSLANLFGRPGNRERQVAGFRELIAKPVAGGNLVLVTHGSTILAFTGVSPAQGEAIVVTPLGGGELRVAGRIAPP